MGLVYFPKFTIKNQPHVGKYAIHGWYGFQCCTGDVVFVPLISAPKTKKTRWETNIYVPWAVIADGSISLTWQSIYDSLTFLSISFPYHFPSTPFRSISSRLSSKSPSNQISTISSTTSPKKPTAAGPLQKLLGSCRGKKHVSFRNVVPSSPRRLMRMLRLAKLGAIWERIEARIGSIFFVQCVALIRGLLWMDFRDRRQPEDIPREHQLVVEPPSTYKGWWYRIGK